jgi:quercetin dioxygenase-like cupin family protein
METQTKQSAVNGPVETFRFTPGARTAWHAHQRGQSLWVTEGVGLVQPRGGEIIEVRPGDVIYTPPGEWHWHGAAPDHSVTRVAMWEVHDRGTSATWGAHASDAEYGAPPRRAGEQGA